MFRLRVEERGHPRRRDPRLLEREVVPAIVDDREGGPVAWVVLGERPRLALARVDAAAVGRRGHARALAGSPTLAVPKDR